MKKTVEYVVRTTVNPITQETQTLPVVVNRREPVDLVDVVANCIDRNLMRIAVYELVCEMPADREITAAIIINEAIEISKVFGVASISPVIWRRSTAPGKSW